ncbi:MAG: CaiB/BaiF CoA-transferase family protein, partial [Pseudomonadota bacterium]
LAALRHRDQTGEGQHIDLALVDAQMAWLINEGTNTLTSGKPPIRRGNAHPNIVPYDVFAGSDGHIILACGNDGQFNRMMHAFDRPDLADDARFQTNPLRITNRDALTEEIAALFGSFPTVDLLDKLQAVGVPCGPIHTIDQALSTEQAVARGMVQRMAHPDATAGEVALLGNPLKFSATPVTYRRPPPRFGQDTQAIMKMFDISASSGADED